MTAMDARPLAYGRVAVVTVLCTRFLRFVMMVSRMLVVHAMLIVAMPERVLPAAMVKPAPSLKLVTMGIVIPVAVVMSIATGRAWVRLAVMVKSAKRPNFAMIAMPMLVAVVMPIVQRWVLVPRVATENIAPSLRHVTTATR